MIKKIGKIILIAFIMGNIVSPFVAFGQTPGLTCPDGTPAEFDDLGNKICDASGGGTTNTGGRGTSVSSIASAVGSAVATVGNPIARSLFSMLGHIVMTLSALVLMVSGLALDTVVDFSILKMYDIVGSSSDLGAGISGAWGTLRDIANIFFIFILLYTAFRAMFSLNFGNVGKTIGNIILVALLINFSLFFTKVVIDASNVVAIGFYNAIKSTNETSIVGNTGVGGTANFKGISGGYMRLLGLQSFYSANILDGYTEAHDVLILGFASSTFMLVAAVILGITAIMFAARFIILIFLMVLSPVALIAIIVPGLRGRFDQWFSSLINQSFFAPVFLALTWVSFKLGSTLKGAITASGVTIEGKTLTEITTNTPGAIGLILNFILIIGFSIIALVVSKQMASKSAGFSSVSGAIGAGAFGGLATISRNTVGRGARWVSENQRDRLSKTALGRATLWTANKTASGSMDARSVSDSKLGKALGFDKTMGDFGKAGGKGGFNKVVDEKAKKEADYAKYTYGLSDSEKASLEIEKDKQKKDIEERRRAAYNTSVQEAKKAEKDKKDYLKSKTEEEQREYDDAVAKKKLLSRELNTATDAQRRNAIESQIKGLTVEIKNSRNNLNEARKNIEENDEHYIQLKTIHEEKNSARNEAKKRRDKKEIDKEEYSKELQTKMGRGENRMEEYAKRVESRPIGIGSIIKGFQGNQAAARKIREVAKGKDKKSKKELREFLENEGVLESDNISESSNTSSDKSSTTT